eukprot:m.289465 g.289465  ORF g.289465 m.289465 type:complete len:531 (+) comp12135_c0_seq1:290-1882(+)
MRAARVKTMTTILAVLLVEDRDTLVTVPAARGWLLRTLKDETADVLNLGRREMAIENDDIGDLAVRAAPVFGVDSKRVVRDAALAVANWVTLPPGVGSVFRIAASHNIKMVFEHARAGVAGNLVVKRDGANRVAVPPKIPVARLSRAEDAVVVAGAVARTAHDGKLDRNGALGKDDTVLAAEDERRRMWGHRENSGCASRRGVMTVARQVLPASLLSKRGLRIGVESPRLELADDCGHVLDVLFVVLTAAHADLVRAVALTQLVVALHKLVDVLARTCRVRQGLARDNNIVDVAIVLRCRDGNRLAIAKARHIVTRELERVRMCANIGVSCDGDLELDARAFGLQILKARETAARTTVRAENNVLQGLELLPARLAVLMDGHDGIALAHKLFESLDLRKRDPVTRSADAANNPLAIENTDSALVGIGRVTIHRRISEKLLGRVVPKLCVGGLVSLVRRESTIAAVFGGVAVVAGLEVVGVPFVQRSKVDDLQRQRPAPLLLFNHIVCALLAAVVGAKLDVARSDARNALL